MTTKEYQAVKDYLATLNRYNKHINRNIEQIYELKELAKGVSSVKYGDKVQSGGSQQRMASFVAAIMDLEEETDALIDKYVNLKEKIIDEILSLEKWKHREILLGIYVDGDNLFDVAHHLDMKYDTCKHAHKKACEKFYVKYEHNILYNA